MSKKVDAVIIGAGVIGANLGYELARRRATGPSTSTSSPPPATDRQPILRDRARPTTRLAGSGHGYEGFSLLEGLGELPRASGTNAGTAKFVRVRRLSTRRRRALYEEGAPALRRDRRAVRGAGTRPSSSESHADRRRACPAQATRGPKLLGRPDQQIGASSSPRRPGYVTDPNWPPTTCSARPRPRAASSCSTPRSAGSGSRTAGWPESIWPTGRRSSRRSSSTWPVPHSFVINEMAG